MCPRANHQVGLEHGKETRLTLFRAGGCVAGIADFSLRSRYIGAYELDRAAANDADVLGAGGGAVARWPCFFEQMIAIFSDGHASQVAAVAQLSAYLGESKRT